MESVPRPFPVPPNFPISWPEPWMADLTWQQDRMHVPEPMTPMSAWWSQRFAEGFTQGLAAAGIPMDTRVARLNTYFYMSIMPNIPPEEMAVREEAVVASVQQAVATFWPRWEGEWLPELQETWRRWEAHDLGAASDADLAKLADELHAIFVRLWHIHFEMLIAAMVGMSSWVDLYAELFPGAEPLDAYRLLQGFDNKSLAAGRALWRLSREVREEPALCDLVTSTPAAELPAVLATTEAGRKLLVKMSGYLAEFGRRSDNVQEMAVPSWTEVPTPAYENLRAYLAQDEDPDDLLRAGAEERDRLVAEAREAIKNHPEHVRGMFEGLLAAGQACSRVQEDHNYWIDQRSVHEVRQLCLEIGRRLVAKGVLAAVDDVFMLELPEAVARLSDDAGDARDLVLARRAEIDRWCDVDPAPMAGMDYGVPPENPITRAIMRFFGPPPSEPPTDRELHGNAGSGGTVRATARIVLTIADGGRLQPGDILVTPTTAPPWTPLFATAAAVVTETGGPLSHCAIVAREYRIPAVVGAAGATSLIKDGEVIEVDGDAGVVRILR